MRQEIFKYKKPKDFYFYRISLYSLIILYVFIVIRQVMKLIGNFQNQEMVLSLIVFVIIGMIVYMLSQINILFKEYHLADHEKSIALNSNDNTILIQQGQGKEFLIKKEEILIVEMFDSKLATFPLGYFSYILIRLKTGEKFIITEFTVPYGKSDILKILKGLKRKNHRRIFNRIN